MRSYLALLALLLVLASCTKNTTNEKTKPSDALSTSVSSSVSGSQDHAMTAEGLEQSTASVNTDTISSAAGKSQKAVYEIVSKNINRVNGDDENDDIEGGLPNIHFFVVKKSADGKTDKNFNQVECVASDYQGYTGKCSVITLLDGRFLLADCFSHNSVCHSCVLRRFNSDGTEDSKIKSPFESETVEIVDGSPEHEIKNIRQVNIEKNWMISIDGNFISPLIGWTREQARNDIGDASGTDGIVLLKQDGTFVSFIPSKNH
jgi:hypothetical protein